jgi:hypothetical protein
MDFTWVTSDDANAIQNTIVDAKGDLISATGSDVPARLAVGANGESLVADSSTATGLKWQGSWTSWTPAYTGLTVGNGTSTGRYQRVGNTVIAQAKLTWGSTTSASVPIYVTLPVANSASSENIAFQTFCYDDSSGTPYTGVVNLANDYKYSLEKKLI